MVQTEIERLQNENLELKTARDHLQAIVDKLAKCWRLNGEGELIQDVPIVPGMNVWQLETSNAGRTWQIVKHSVGVCFPSIYPYPGGIARRIYNTFEAAKKARVVQRRYSL